MKKLLLALSLVVTSAVVAAQNPAPGDRTLGPGDPGWKGQTIQIGPPHPTPRVGGLDPATIVRPLSDEWRSYSGDLSGKRYSLLKAVNTETVKNLSLKWLTRLTTGCGPTGATPAGAAGAGGGRGGGRGGGDAGPAPMVVGGLGTGAANSCGPRGPNGGMLVVDGIIYAGSPFNVYAIDARDGTVLWQYYWKTRGGTALGTRGPGMWHNYIYFTMHDDWVVCLDRRDGHEVWRHEIAPHEQQYFSSNAPMVIGDHVLVGTGNDLDAPAFLKSLNPETGAVEWILYSTAQKEGDPGLETWASLDAARHGNGATWIPGAYDPETKLYMYGTGNPTPAYTAGRGEGDNLFTSSLIAVNVDTGKMAWYFQTSPHDTHDWDSTQTPLIADMPFGGRPRKLVMTATRNGYFFVLDRTNGQPLVTTKFGLTNNWALGIDQGQPRRNPHKDATVAGSLIPSSITNYPPPTFSPDTGFFYVHEQNSLRVNYLMEPDPRGSMGLGGTASGGNLDYGTGIIAIDYQTGRIAWRHQLDGGGSPGLLSTAGGVLFVSNSPSVEAWDARTGKALWYSQIGGLSAPAETFTLDGKQHVLFSGPDGLYMFVLN